jgi:hypothetical protein
LKKSDFESIKADLPEEIKNLNQTSERRDLRLENFIKKINEHLSISKLESNERRDKLRHEMNVQKSEKSTLR